MGMFDSFYFKKEKKCSFCNNTHKYVQTKKFDLTLEEYKIGDILNTAGFYSKIITEKLYCSYCKNEENIYLVIKDNIFISANRNKKKAKKIFKNFKYNDLLKLYTQISKENKNKKHKLSYLKNLYYEYNRYQEYLSKNEEHPMKKIIFRNTINKSDKEFLLFLLKEINNIDKRKLKYTF